MKTTKTNQLSIEVYADWQGMPNPYLIGVLHALKMRGKEIFSFEYDADWIQHKEAKSIDPDLELWHGKQYAPKDKDNFGIFLDSSPDRWGRFLMDRREALLARKENRPEHKLLETDYLLGVFDKHRIGGLRFKLDPNGPFLDNNQVLASPPWASLRELEHASLELEKRGAENNPSYSKWLKMLIAPGGSLGGARPKASIIDEENHLWIAKFPSLNDDNNIGAWEMVAYNLAKNSGIIMPESKIQKFNSPHHTFLSKRFDRTNEGERLHFASALTLLQRTDGDNAELGASYLEMAEFIIRMGEESNEDLEQLWRRIVFFICISNVDDHLRNHGFILKQNGWRLSPAYDINPNASGDGLKLNVSESDNSQDLDLAKEVAEYFRLNPRKAEEIMQEILKATKYWRKEANNIGISQQEQNRMARAFRIAESS